MSLCTIRLTLSLFFLTLLSATVFSQTDDPCGAPSLTVNTSCIFATYTNAGASSSTGVPAPGCASYSGGDVWFTITVPASGSVTVDANTGVITDGGMAIYSGNCSSLSLLQCNDDSSPNGLMPLITLTGQAPGATLWIRFWEYGNNNNGTFDICASQPPLPPANDECSGAIGLTVNPDNLCGTTTTGSIASATSSSQVNGCGGTSDDDVWYSFIATGPTHIVTLQNVSGSTTDLYHSVYAGSCGSPGAALVCSDPNSSTITGLTPGNTYFVRIYSWTSTTGQTTTFDVCIGTPPPPPANDECSGAIGLTVNPDNLCSTTTTGSVASATSSSQVNGCGGTSDDDVWYSFIATGPTHIITLQNISGSTTDLYHSVYAGSCGSPGAALVCSDPNSSTITGLTPGNTYFVRIYSWTSTTGQTTVFDVCIGTPPPPPANDECSGAISVPVSTSSGGCSPTTGSIASSTPSSQANGCSGNADDDVWYSFVATTSAVQLSLTNVSGSTIDLYHSVYAGSCGSPGAALVCSDPNSSTITGLTPGNTYFVRIYSWTSTSGQNTVFDVCITEAGACGTPNNQDYCVAPAILSQGTGAFSSNTSGTYTSDTPANLNTLFCGSIENNSWYQFVATSATEVFNFSSVTGCTSGIQAEVYGVTNDVNGCCTNFTSMSNCWNPATATPGIVTATGLTIGNTYVLMVDGYGGDICDFTVTNWTAIGILPIELNKFEGEIMARKNIIKWETSSEKDNDYFNLLRSTDAINFEKIVEVDGAGNSVATLNYQYEDIDIISDIIYYQLEQIDFNGASTRSEIIVLSRMESNNELFVSPNPTNGLVTILVSGNNKNVNQIEIIDLSGKVLLTEIITTNVSLKLNIEKFQKGLYIVRHTDNNGTISTEKLIKF